MMKFILYLLIFAINTLIITAIIDWFVIGFPIPVLKRKKYKKEYILNVPNRIDYQKNTECSGFAAAYVLRSLGVEVEGNDMYVKMPGKFWNGAVLTKNLRKVLRRYGYKVIYKKGNLDTLKSDLCEEKRVIAFLKTRPDKRWLHFVPIVGYDEENIFIAESMKTLENCNETQYNRRLTNNEFLKLWNTRFIYMPFYINTYLVIEPRK